MTSLPRGSISGKQYQQGFADLLADEADVVMALREVRLADQPARRAWVI